jgi:hypothetical protein
MVKGLTMLLKSGFYPALWLPNAEYLKWYLPGPAGRDGMWRTR